VHHAVSQDVSKKATKALATSASPRIPPAIPPEACALVCVVSNCRLSRCISGRVTLRIGKCRTSEPGDAAGGEGTGKVEDVGAALMCASSEDVIVDVVFVSVCSVLGAGCARWHELGSPRGASCSPAGPPQSGLSFPPSSRTPILRPAGMAHPMRPLSTASPTLPSTKAPRTA